MKRVTASILVYLMLDTDCDTEFGLAKDILSRWAGKFISLSAANGTQWNVDPGGGFPLSLQSLRPKRKAHATRFGRSRNYKLPGNVRISTPFSVTARVCSN